MRQTNEVYKSLFLILSNSNKLSLLEINLNIILIKLHDSISTMEDNYRQSIRECNEFNPNLKHASNSCLEDSGIDLSSV